jgi:acetylornithine/N-succinyldiaminopimelate aminotransferase
LVKKLIEKENIEEIVEVRSKGLMIGIKFTSKVDVKTLAQKFLDEKIVVGTAGNNVLRLLPPLIIKNENIQHFVYILKDLFNKMYISTKAS